MLRGLILAFASFAALPARACDIALLLALDVSGSVDPAEYDVQRAGLALALRDGSVSEALVRADARVAVLQWTGSSRQRMTIPWTRMSDFKQVDALADLIEGDPRAWRNFSTAIGGAMDVALRAFDQVPDCKRRVVDISGDGVSNEGIDPIRVKPRMQQHGIIVNALVIEGADDDLTGYYWENVITGPGAFVATANGYSDYPKRIRQKLLRETAPVFSDSIPSLVTDFPFVITKNWSVITSFQFSDQLRQKTAPIWCSVR